MSGLTASALPLETGLPPLTIWKCVPFTSRATNTPEVPCTSSDQTTHGTVGCPAFIVPAATRGSSASAPGLLLSVQAFSADFDARHGPAPPAEVSSGCGAAVVLPTAAQPNAPSAAGLATALAAKTRSLRIPLRPLPVSYQTTHGTVSPGPGERHVRLDPVARRVDVQRRQGGRAQRRALDADLLPAEPAHGVAARGLRPGRARHGARPDRLDDEDLVADRALLLPRHPRPRVRAGDRRAADDDRRLGVLRDVDVQDGRPARGLPALPGEHPLAVAASKRLARISCLPKGEM